MNWNALKGALIDILLRKQYTIQYVQLNLLHKIGICVISLRVFLVKCFNPLISKFLPTAK